MNSKVLSTLEYGKITEMLADCAMTEGARDEALRLTPSDDPERVRRLIRETTDAKELSYKKGTPPFGGIKDILAALDRADKGSSLNTSELLRIAEVLHTARVLVDYEAQDKRIETPQTSLDRYFSNLNPNRLVEDRIRKAIPAEDTVADEASPALADIRRKMRNAQNKVKDLLQRYTSGGEMSKYLQDNLVTTRGGRYVIPVKSEYRGEVKGLVHDTSSSGATLFIEPMAVVETNNELRELAAKEQHEIDRILAELSALVSDISALISQNYHMITALALIFARAELSFRMKATPAVISDKKIIRLNKARHPLLNQAKVVPTDVTLGGEYDQLIITGPNTGGKTVTLKTIGLFCLMAQSGLHIPAADGSELGVFDEVLADIGDEQSIEQSLSTFSAHMVNIVSILGQADENSLVLIDELGAGTDPVEGAALAVSILEEIHSFGSLCAATTHYAELKEYALNTEGVRNASCEFDVNTLKPTYRLIIGTPGKSNAFAISQRLGISDKIIERAGSYINNEDRRFEEVIGRLEKERMAMEEERNNAEQLRAEAEREAAQMKKELSSRLAGAEKEAKKQRAQAAQILSRARATSEYVLDQLDEIKKQQDKAGFADSLARAKRDIRKRLSETDDIVNPVSEGGDGEYKLPRPLKKGDEVHIVNIDKDGVLTEDPAEDGSVSVKAGIITMKTSVSNLMLIEKSAEGKKKQEKKVPSYRAIVSQNFRPEIDLRGQMADDAWFMVDKYLDEAKIAGVKSVTLIHGKGTGVLRSSIQRNLKGDSRVASFRIGLYGEGDGGVTVVELK